LRGAAVREIQDRCQTIAAGQGVEIRFSINHEVDSVSMAPWLRDVVGEAVTDVASGRFDVPREVILSHGGTASTGVDEIGGVRSDFENGSKSVTGHSTATEVDRATCSASARGESYESMTSGAGHDAQYMARITSVAMLFVRCKDGISHSPHEHVDPKDAAVGAITLLRAVERLAELEANRGRRD
jgi:acetylornithine deacetylase/succinyl-diaminopimelate desuccinylase-like protein